VIEVLEYDPAWPRRFDQLRVLYSAALDAAHVRVSAIAHVGSTAVPGLAGKPVIDVDIVVDVDDVVPATAVLESRGFRSLGELGIPQRWAFKEPPAFAGTNTYVIVRGSLALKNHLSLRDALRTSRELRREYAAVKRQVARNSDDIFEHGRGKNAIIQKILATAGLTTEELASIAGNQVPGP
jgi:GrpB-like predicted nucleotidyltransferase (UPF0157 family)